MYALYHWVIVVRYLEPAAWLWAAEYVASAVQSLRPQRTPTGPVWCPTAFQLSYNGPILILFPRGGPRSRRSLGLCPEGPLSFRGKSTHTYETMEFTAMGQIMWTRQMLQREGKLKSWESFMGSSAGTWPWGVSRAHAQHAPAVRGHECHSMPSACGPFGISGYRGTDRTGGDRPGQGGQGSYRGEYW